MFDRLSLKQKLFASFGVMVFLVAVVSVFATTGTRQISSDLQELYDDRFDHIIELSEMIREMAQLRSQLYQIALNPESRSLDRYQQDARHAIDRIEALILLCEDHCIRTNNLPAFDPVQEGWEGFREATEDVMNYRYTGQVSSEGARRLQNMEQAYEELDNAAWSMAMGQDRLGRELYERAVGAASLVQLVALALLVGAVGFAVFLAIITARTIGKPIYQCRKVVQAVAEGDLSRTLDPRLMTRSDALGDLARGIEQMRVDLTQLVGTMAAISDDLGSSAHRLTDAVRDNHQNVERQREDTDQVATAMEEMTQTVQEVASNASAAAEATRSADSRANKGHEVVQTASDSVNRLSLTIENAAGVIRQLSEESGQIGSVLNVINGIAEQTNLLALNAAIESARAGEAGRGFAVVADEVRTLAMRTQESTQEIDKTIGRLQETAKESVHVMESGREKAQDVVDMTGEVAEALQAIVDAITQVDVMNTQIASAAEEQSATTIEMNQSVANIRDVAENTAAKASDIGSISDRLESLTSRLGEQLSKFKRDETAGDGEKWVS